MKLRLDIQIMRGLAVLLVVAFHLGLASFDAGFLGVDVFFVISGYLMAVLYKNDDIPQFYRRRAARLLPAYFATVFLTVSASALITLPSEHSQVVEQGLFASVLASNFGFWAQNSYFSKAEFSPLLHLWSLGVEAQFYVIVPLVAWMATRSRWLFAAALLGSLLICLATVLVSPKTAFFLMPFRIWQFLAGFAVARWFSSAGEVKFERPVIGAVALAIIIGTVALFPVDGSASSVTVGHPAAAAVVVTVATALILALGLPRALEMSLLGRGLRRLGDWSYSIYLAHFPVIVLALYQPFSGTIIAPSDGAQGLLILVLIGLFSAVLYYLFDRPRFYRGTLPTAVMLAASGVAVALLSSVISKNRFSEEELRLFAANEDRAVYRCGKIFRVINPTSKICEIGDSVDQYAPAVLLVGDSHSDSIKTSFAEAANDRGYRAFFTVSNNPLTGSPSSEEVVRLAENVGAKAIFVHFSGGNALEALDSGIAQEAAQARMSLVWLLPVPTYKEPVPKILWETRSFGGHVSRPPDNLATTQEVAAAVGAARIDAIDLRLGLCRKECDLSDNEGRPLYFDNGHLTLTGAQKLEPYIDAGFDLLAVR